MYLRLACTVWCGCAVFGGTLRASTGDRAFLELPRSYAHQACTAGTPGCWLGAALCCYAAPRARPSLDFAQAVAPMNIQAEVLRSFGLVVTSAHCSAVRRCDSGHWKHAGLPVLEKP